MDSSIPGAKPARSTPLRILELLLRVYVPCLIASPLALWSTVQAATFDMGVLNDLGPRGLLGNPGILLAWSFLLFVGALMIGLPLVIWISRVLRPVWARTSALMGLSTIFFVVLHVGPGLMIIGRDSYIIYAAPSGAITALFCCVMNFDRLRQPNLRLL